MSVEEFFSTPGVDELIKEYREECSNPDFMMCVPDKEQYLALEKAGNFYVLGVFLDGERVEGPDDEATYIENDKGKSKLVFIPGHIEGGTLAGFAAVITTKVPHHKDEVMAVMESVFVRRACRVKWNSVNIIRAAKRVAFAAGAKGLYVSAPAGSRFEQFLFKAGAHANTVFYLT